MARASAATSARLRGSSGQRPGPAKASSKLATRSVQSGSPALAPAARSNTGAGRRLQITV